MSDFVHLHCHSEYSLLDGAIRIKDLCNQAIDYGMHSVAITDHGNLFGAIPFYKQAKRCGLKPIIGCEVYVCNDHTDKSQETGRERFHLILLAQNKLGYHNLVKLVSHGALYGFHYKPRVDKNLLKMYSEGIVALSACISGEIPKAILNKGMDTASRLVDEYSAIYPNRFFLEIQENGLKQQLKVNEGLSQLSLDKNIPLVATNDCHYLRKDDYEAHDILLCVQTQSQVNDEKRFRLDSDQLYYKSTEEMERDFKWAPKSALSNTVRIAEEMCEDYDFEFNKAHFPVYKLPEGMTLDLEFRRLAQDGLKQRLENATYPCDKTLYEERLQMELDVIAKMGYQGYFLIVQDFINWAKEHGVPVGPGRGSAAGSIVAWALRITNIDPIPYNLLFERFLNPERVSLPDIDVDFCERKRHEVLSYVTEHYGADSVSMITTFGTMKAKAVIKDVGRALGMSFKDTDRIAKLIPDDLKITVQKALDGVAELQGLYDSDTQIKKLIDTSLRLEGLPRHASTHAAGVVISDRPMVDYLPLYRGKREEIVTQYDKNIVEEVGLVKFDFLGLKTMTLIQDTLDIIGAQGKVVPDMDTLPLDDVAVYKLYAAGDTDGIFQVESSGMRQYLRQLRPTVFEDIIAMLALYRPGPLGANMVGDFINRKHGIAQVTYPLPELKPCLKDTYGVIVYQEQVMQIAQVVANYTLGGADMLRRAMGKKDPEKMAAERGKFIEGATLNKVDPKIAEEIFTTMEKFAEYGFNKSHSAAYALISYHTAYLKAHYKPEFMAALLTSEMGNQDKVLKYVASCKDMGIDVEQATIQKSMSVFSVHDGKVLFGLGGIKNVGNEAIREIVEAREKDGPFTSLYDLCCRVSLRKVTKRVLESLIKGGAMDCLEVSRASLVTGLETVVARAQKKQKDADSGQLSMLGMVTSPPVVNIKGLGIDCDAVTVPEWSDEDKLAFEKEALGFFLTSHPLIPFKKESLRLSMSNLEDCAEMSPFHQFKCAVLVNGIKEVYTKRGDRMAFCTVSDLTGSGECVFFPKTYEAVRPYLLPDTPLELTAKVQYREGQTVLNDSENSDEAVPVEVKLEGVAVRPLIEAVKADKSPFYLELHVDHFTPDHISSLHSIINKHAGNVEMNLVLYSDGYWCKLSLPSDYRIEPGPELGSELMEWEKMLQRTAV